MKRTTVSLPEEIAMLAAREARRRGVSISEVARQALAEYLGVASVANGAPRTIPFAAIGASGQRHTSRDFDRTLAREWPSQVEDLGDGKQAHQ